MKRKQPLYPGCAEAEKEKARSAANAFQRPAKDGPDMIGLAPNYDAFPGWTPEKVLAFLNID